MKQTQILQKFCNSLLIGLILIYISFIVSCFLLASSAASAQAANTSTASICAPNNIFSSVNQNINIDGLADREDQAIAWIKSMMEPRVSTTTGQAEIAPDELYENGYQGAINGSFTLSEARDTVSNTPLKVTSPDELSDSYRGIINGSASVPDPSKDYVVRAYLKTDSEYEQGEAVGGSVQADGSWTIDTTSVGDYSGSWAFRLYGVESDTQVGLSWPRPVQYKDLAIRYYLLTDGLYIQSEQEAQASGRWSFTANNNEGDKVFQVVDTKTGDILAEHVKLESTGMIRSYEYLPGIDGYGTSREQNSYTYDQALALMVAIAHGDKDMADELLGGLELIQVTEGELAGAFPSSAEQRDISEVSEEYYTGVNAVALYALTRYVEAYGTDNSAYDMLISGLDYLALLKSTNGPGEGLYEGGREVNSDGVVESISWHSTEHNTDAWHVLYRAGMVLEDDNLLDQAADLSEVIIEKLWSEEEGRFYQGLNDDNYALDTASWGSIFLAAVGEHEKAIRSANNTERYKHTSAYATGYTPYDRADSVPTVWYEGTYGVVSAYRSLGDMESASRVVEESIPGQRGNGGFPYADDEDTINGRTTASSVASTAWFVLSTKYPEGIWSECVYKEEIITPPIEEPNLPPAPGPGKPPAVKNPSTAPTNVTTPVAPKPHHAPVKGVSASVVYGSDDYGYEVC